MSTVRLLPEEDLDAFITIVINAYPGFPVSTPEDRERIRGHLSKFLTQERPGYLYGLYRKKTLMGGMALYDFTMNVFGIPMLAGGVGLVAVDLLHKREKVCKEMISFFLHHYREREACLALLHPFRPDFYKQMGFGFGTKMHEHIFTPGQLPHRSKDHIHIIGENDKQKLWDCYTRYVHRTHGMIEKTEFEIDRLFSNHEQRIIGYKEGDEILGYLVFTFKRDQSHFVINDIVVKEFVFENEHAFSELLTFLQIQHDQVRFIIFQTQDEYFHHLFSDPRDISGKIMPVAYHQSNTSGVGLMYRIIDTPGFFNLLSDHKFGNECCALKISLTDTLLEENGGSIIVSFEDGMPTCDSETFDVEIEMDISDFTSMVLGVVPFSRLHLYGLASISDPEYVDVVNRLFKTDEKPQCSTEF
ncbi:MAG: GNAT family N-acetyltransferase [Theionarchaea archaeon]|nr:GNAT family N-acetyltransferase [Theionarchaea archaeon]